MIRKLKHQINLNQIIFGLFIVLMHSSKLDAQQIVFSRGDVTTGNWGDVQLPWFYQTDILNPNQGDPDNNNTTPNVIRIGHNNNTTMTLNGRSYRAKELIFEAGATSDRTFVGNNLDMRFNNGGPTKIENLSSGNHTFNNQIVIFDGVTEFNPINGNLIFQGNVLNQGNFIDVFGNNNHILRLSGDVQGTGGITLKENSVIEIASPMTYTGGTAIEAGTFRIMAGGNLSDSTPVTISSAGTFDLNDQSITVRSVSETANSNGGSINLGSGTLTIAGDYTGDRFQNTITGTGNLVKNGTGTWVLYGTNTYSGTTTINSGVLRINNVDGLGTIDGLVTVNTGGVLELNAGVNYPAQALVLNGTGISDGGALRKIDSGTHDFPGNIDLNSDTRINVIGGTLDFRGVMNLNGHTIYIGGSDNFFFGSTNSFLNATKTTGNGAIFKDGTGRLDIRPTSDISGNITLVSGEIRQATGSYNSAGTLIIQGGTYRSDGSTDRTVPKAVSVEGDFTLGHSSASIDGPGSVILNGDVNLNDADRTITMPNENFINGIISNGGLVKAGTGTLVLGGANTYDGITSILTGTLQLASGGDLSDNTVVTISSGASFDLNNENVTVRSVSEQGPENAGTINLGTGTLTLAGGWSGDVFQNSITGTGNLVKNGTGLLDVFGTQNYTGTTTINGGTLRSNVNLASSEIIVNDGGTFTQRNTSDISVNNLTLNSGGTLSIPAGRILTINGILTIDSDAVISADGTLAFGQNGKLVIKGTSDFETDGKIFPATNGPLDFEIDHNGVVTLHETRSLNGQILVTNGVLLIKEGVGITATDLELTTNGSITLNSISNSYSSLIVDNITNNGTINYNRFVNVIGTSAGGGNDLITPPLNGQRFDDFATANNGVLAASGTLRAFAPFVNDANPGVYSNFDIVTDANTILEAGIGYRAAAGDVLQFTGTANTTDIDVAISTATGTFGEWNLIGNPYPSYLDIDAFLRHEATPGTQNIQLLDNASGIYGYNGNATNRWNIITLSNSLGKLMAPGQGFFVASGSAGGNLQFTTTMRSTTGDDDFIQGRNAALVYLKLQAATNSNSYTTDFYFNENSSLGLDPGYDAKTWGGQSSGFMMYSHLVQDNTGLPIALQSLHSSDLVETTVIPLGVNSNAGEQITFSITESSLPSTIDVYLEDTVTNTFTLLNSGDYTVTPNEALNGVGRFYLRFGDAALSTTETTLNDLNIYTNQNDKTIIIAGQLLEPTTASVYDIQGRLVNTASLVATSRSQTIDVSHLSSGVYVVQLSNSQQSTTKKVVLR
jgi:autotransporter-associated beta strand protein